MESAYQCNRCGYESSYKHAMQRHFARKSLCTPTLADIDVALLLTELNTVKKDLNEKTYDCEYCGVKFNHRATKCAHKKVCKVKRKADADAALASKNALVKSEETSEETKLLQKEIAELKSLILRQQPNTTYNHCNVINVNNFGEENIDHLTKR